VIVIDHVNVSDTVIVAALGNGNDTVCVTDTVDDKRPSLPSTTTSFRG
jgi:hypothetical protein